MASQVVQACQSRQPPACWAGISQLFVGAGRHKHALLGHVSEKRSPSPPLNADCSLSGGKPQGKAADECNAKPALQAPKVKKLVVKGPDFFNKVAQLIIAAAFTLWRFAPVEAKGCRATNSSAEKGCTKKPSSISREPSPFVVAKVATSLVALGPRERASQEKIKRATSGAYGATHLAVIASVIWQASTVRYHALSFPSGIWVGGHDPHMNPSCSTLFEVARLSVFATIAILAAQLAVLILLRASLAATLQVVPERVQLVLISTIRFIAGSVGSWLIGVSRTIFGGISFAVLLHTHLAECLACQSLTACVSCSCFLYCTMTIHDTFALFAWMRPHEDLVEAPYDPETDPLLTAEV